MAVTSGGSYVRDIIMTMARQDPTPTVANLVRLPVPLRERLLSYADRRKLSIAAAIRVLLTDALDVDERRINA